MLIEYNIYCDESCHLENDGIKPMVLGSIWCPTAKKDEIFTRLREIKLKYHLGHVFELKWNKVSPGKLEFYKDVIDYFFDDDDLHFRVLVVPDKSVLDHAAYDQSHDDFYFKMYFDLLKVILDPKNGYNIYLDIKDTRSQLKINHLKDVLRSSHYDYEHNIIRRIQQIRSHEVEIVQLADLLTGAISYVHRGLSSSHAKLALIEKIQKRSGYSLKFSTLYKEDKVNIFIWRSTSVKNAR